MLVVQIKIRLKVLFEVQIHSKVKISVAYLKMCDRWQDCECDFFCVWSKTRRIVSPQMPQNRQNDRQRGQSGSELLSPLTGSHSNCAGNHGYLLESTTDLKSDLTWRLKCVSKLVWSSSIAISCSFGCFWHKILLVLSACITNGDYHRKL